MQKSAWWCSYIYGSSNLTVVSFVSRSLTFRLETKMPWCQTPSRKRKLSCLQLWRWALIRSTKRWIFKSMWNIESSRHTIFIIRLRVLYTGLLLWRHFHAPKRDAERNELWLVVWHVGQTASWVGLGQWKLPSIPDLQSSVWRSGYARLVEACTGEKGRAPISSLEGGHRWDDQQRKRSYLVWLRIFCQIKMTEST